MKQKKIISILLTSTLALGIIISVPSQKTNAATLDDNKKELASSESNSVDSNIIEEIQNKYLKQNSDGTFYILDDAYNEFDKDIIESLKSGMNEINDYIKDGKLKFDILKENKETEVINTYQSNNIANKRQTRAAATIARIVSSYNYCSNYRWYWWGYKTDVNARGSALLRNNFTADGLVVGGGATLASVLCPPAAPLIGTLGFIGSTKYAYVVMECANGADNGEGVQVTGWGKPSSGAVFAVKAYY